ncbi:MAG: septum formation initiator family protein [Chitinispirillales bacterium]|jgi:cytoskeletal protein RodZ|nr:septum formation initiator family protein [Chitinispirillales bacterium]
MKNPIFKILVAGVIIVVAFAWRQPIIYFIDKTKIQKELKEKTAEEDSLRQIVQTIKDNAEEKRKTARKLGYSKNDEIMIKIVTPDDEKESKKVKTNAFLSISAVLVFFLIITFAVSSRNNDKTKLKSE